MQEKQMVQNTSFAPSFVCPHACLHWHPCLSGSWRPSMQLHEGLHEMNYTAIILLRTPRRISVQTAEVSFLLNIFIVICAYDQLIIFNQTNVKNKKQTSGSVWISTGTFQHFFPPPPFYLFFCLCCFLSIAMHHLTLPKQVWAAAHQLKAIWSGAQLPGG